MASLKVNAPEPDNHELTLDQYSIKYSVCLPSNVALPTITWLCQQSNRSFLA